MRLLGAAAAMQLLHRHWNMHARNVLLSRPPPLAHAARPANACPAPQMPALPRRTLPAGGTRTCIHTPSEPMRAEEMSGELAAGILEGAALVYFDGRLTEPAINLAAAARARGGLSG